MNISSPKLTIVMYHYVRPLAATRFPNIKGLDVALFDEQLEYLARHYTLISMEDVVDAIEGRARLPSRAALLTFDDGYLDHYCYVFPRLVQRGIKGAFFPASCSAIHRTVLSVNKIHFTLASGIPPEVLIEFVEHACIERAQDYNLHDLDYYRTNYRIGNFLDDAGVNYIKLMLQHALPEKLRTEIVDELFQRHVSSDERCFAEELYATVDQLRTMKTFGMHIGSHGALHQWLGHMPKSEQEMDIDSALGLLDLVGASADYRTMCYPYGSYNQDTIDAMAARGFKLALTTEVALADARPAHRFALPRLDTNHLPTDRSAAPNEWVTAAQ